jgi:predicted aldo/keto reductase-like oxidoreductase
MEYRKLPHGNAVERFSVLGLGMGGIQNASSEEIEKTIRKAIDNGINFFDLCAGGKNVFEPFGKAIKNQREKVFIQTHFGAVYNENGEYGWSRNLDEIKKTVLWEMEALHTDYLDFGFLHCVDEDDDFDELMSSGVFDYIKMLKEKGVIHHIGFSSHTPSVANRILDTGIVDMMMFSINPAYDFEAGDEYGIGHTEERAMLFRRCEKEGIGISVMKPFFAGKLLDEKTSPFKVAMTRYQCLQYALDRPGVLTVVPGIRGISDLDDLLGFVYSSPEKRDYSILGSFTQEKGNGSCVYCNHCQPCPAGIDIGLVNKYYDLALAGDKLAINHYDKLTTKADACLKCNHCNNRCPFKVKQKERMQIINAYFKSIKTN